MVDWGSLHEHGHNASVGDSVPNRTFEHRRCYGTRSANGPHSFFIQFGWQERLSLKFLPLMLVGKHVPMTRDLVPSHSYIWHYGFLGSLLGFFGLAPIFFLSFRHDPPA